MGIDASILMNQRRPNYQQGVQNYFTAQQNKRANEKSERQGRLDELTLSNAEKEAKKKEKLKEIAKASTNPDGTYNRQRMSGALRQEGYAKEAFEFEQGMQKQDAAMRKKQKENFELRKNQQSRLGSLSRTVMESDNPAQAFKRFQTTAMNEKIPLSRQMMEYTVTDEDSRLSPELAQELDYIGQSTLTPAEKLARNKGGMGKQEIDFKNREFKLKNRKLDFDIMKFNKEVDRDTSGLLPEEKAVVIEEKLRNQYIKQNASYTKVGDSYNRIVAASGPGPEGSRGAGDLALIFNYMKMLDPGSAVRETEFENAENSRAFMEGQGVPSKYALLRDKILVGARLTPKQRNDFTNRAKKLMDAATKGYGRSQKTFTKLSNDYRVKPERVVIDISRQGQQQPEITESNVFEDPEKEKRYQFWLAEQAAEGKLNE